MPTSFSRPTGATLEGKLLSESTACRGCPVVDVQESRSRKSDPVLRVGCLPPRYNHVTKETQFITRESHFRLEWRQPFMPAAAEKFLPETRASV